MRNAVASLFIWALLFLNLCMAAELGFHGGHHAVEIPGVEEAAPYDNLHNVLGREVSGTTVVPAIHHEDHDRITSYYTTIIWTGSWTTLLPAGTPKPLPTSIAPIPASKTAIPSSSRVIASSSAVIGTDNSSTPTGKPLPNSAAGRGTFNTGFMTIVAITIVALVVHIGFML